MDNTVYRDFFARLNNDDASYSYFIGGNLFKLAVLLDICIVGADIHKLGDVFAALSNGDALEKLARLVEDHYGERFGIVAALRVDSKCECTDSCDCHKKIFIERSAVFYSEKGFAQDIISDKDICCKVQQESDNALNGEKMIYDQQCSADDYSGEHYLLFLFHSKLRISK